MASLLLVDDDSDALDILTAILRFEGHLVRTARDGTEGLTALNRGGLPDLVLLDVEMPRLTGPQMATAMFLTNLGRERIPVVLLSGVSRLEGVAERVGTPYYLAKPYSIEAVLALIARALRERTPPSPPAPPDAPSAPE